MGPEHEELDRQIKAVRSQQPDAKLRTFEEVESYFQLAAAYCEFNTETENRFWDRVFRLTTPSLNPYEVGRALYAIVAACIMAGGLGSTKFVMPEAVGVLSDPAWALAEFADLFVRGIEKHLGERRLILVEQVAKACAAPEELLSEDDPNSYFRNLRALIDRVEDEQGV